MMSAPSFKGFRTSPKIVVFLSLVLVTVLFWWYLLGSAQTLRDESISQAELRVRQVNTAVSLAVSMLFNNVDQATVKMVYSYRRYGKDIPPDELNLILKKFPTGAVLQIAVIDAQGYLAYTSLNNPERIFLGDREHFKVHLGSHEDRLFISKPVMGRVSNKWSIQFSRPIIDHGQFRGVVVLSLDPDYLHNELVKLTLGDDDTISIIRSSGEYLARDRKHNEAISTSVPPGRPYLGASAGSSGFFQANSSVDGEDRIFHWVSIRDFPVIVTLGLSKKGILGPIETAIQNEKKRAIVVTVLLWILAWSTVFFMTQIQTHAQKRIALEYAAHHDVLTGLKNRAGLIASLEHMLDTDPTHTQHFSLYFMDLNGFKKINDHYGHTVGDEVLKFAAHTILRCTRSSDIVARFGGDEFVVASQIEPSQGDVTVLTNRINEAFLSPFHIDGNELQIGISIGIAQYPQDGRSIDELLVHSDDSMYMDKQRKKEMGFSDLNASKSSAEVIENFNTYSENG
jgi:diguanylate cyclase (GGDEF)-like protein